jgi:hypothetical protein
LSLRRQSPQNDPTAEFPQGVPRRVLHGVPRGGNGARSPAAALSLKQSLWLQLLQLLQLLLLLLMLRFFKPVPNRSETPSPAPSWSQAGLATPVSQPNWSQTGSDTGLARSASKPVWRKVGPKPVRDPNRSPDRFGVKPVFETGLRPVLLRVCNDEVVSAPWRVNMQGRGAQTMANQAAGSCGHQRVPIHPIIEVLSQRPLTEESAQLVEH